MPESQVNPIKRILIAIDRSAHDQSLFKFLSHVVKMTSLDAVYILHVAVNLDLPDEIAEKYPDLLAPVDESIRKNIQFDLNEQVQLPDTTQLEILIREGNIYHEILKAVKQKGINLLVLGRKSDKKGSLSLVKRMALTSPCSIAIIPEYVPSTLTKVLVPIDYSENSENSLRSVQLLNEKFPKMEVHTLNAYDVPSGYSKLGKTYEEFAKIMEDHAREDGKEFLSRLKLDIPHLQTHFIHSSKGILPNAIYQYAIAHGMDAIIIGSKGRGALSHFILGSVTEALIEQDQYLSLMIVKSRSEGMDLLEALKHI